MAATNSLKVHAIGGRTDNTGAAAVDIDQEELRALAGALLRQGLLANALDGTPNPNGYRVRQNTGTDMNVLVGSGTTKRDLYLLRGTVAGQGSYLVRLDAATKQVSVPATDPSLPARYGVYLFIDDAAYAGDASRAYVDIQCIRGTPNAAPVTPAALSTWSASALLWEFQLAANATAVTNTILDTAATGIDRRVSAALAAQNAIESQIFL